MATDAGHRISRTISPDEALALLGDETRLQILEALGRGDDPVAFSDLYDGVEYDDPSNFNYHLKKLTGHFVRKSDAGYSLRPPGRRILEAILSGAVTEDVVLERTPVEDPCILCGGRMEMSYGDEVVKLYCTDCGGTRDESSPTVDRETRAANDIVGGVALPPAGLRERDPTEVLRAAEVWSVSGAQALSRSVCPRCSGHVDLSPRVCEDHDSTDGRCDHCDQEFGTTLHFECTNCILDGVSVFTAYLLGTTELMGFMIDHGIDPMAPGGFHLDPDEETILSVDPFEARFTFTTNDETLSLTVDDDLSVVDATREDASATA